jgi:transposase
VVERFPTRLEQFRDLVTRYAKRAACHRAELFIVSTVLWLRPGLQDTP